MLHDLENHMVGNEDKYFQDYDPLELTDEGKVSLRVDLAYYLSADTVDDFDGIENAAIWFEAERLETRDDGLECDISSGMTKNGKVIHLRYEEDEVQEA